MPLKPGQTTATSFTATHGQCGTRTYKAWGNMLYRCRTATCSLYPDYGGRGITVCDRWSVFEYFLQDMGECPEGMSIERRDVNGNYELSNCCWTTTEKQMSNRRNSVVIDGKTLRQWADELGISYAAIAARYTRGKRGAELLRCH